MCRVRNLHTGPPWTTAFICITVDDSCLDQDGKFVDEPMTVRMVQWQPFCVKKHFEAKTPVCASCKRTNRTRNFCRERHRHRHLPWCTVYVLLSTLESVDAETVVAGPTTKEDAIQLERKSPSAASVSSESSSLPKVSKAEDPSENSDSRSHNEFCVPIGHQEPTKPKPEPRITGDDINDIADSRTFLATVSVEETSIQWLEIVPLDSTQAPPDFPFQLAPAASTQLAIPMIPFDPTQMGFYPPTMTVTAEQHQNALKSRQQYFFQLQQQQQFPTGAVPAQWQRQQQQQQPSPQQYAQLPCYVQQQPTQGQQQGESQSGATAGEAAAARQQGEDQQQQQQQQAWGTYYATNFAAGASPAVADQQQQQQPAEQAPDSKRARLV